MPSPSTFDEKKFEAENDARTLQSAAEVMADKKRLAAAQKMIETQKKQLDTAAEMVKGRNRQGDALHESF